MWDAVVVRPIINILLVFYKYLGHETILAVTLVTVIIRLAITPLTLTQQKSARKQQELKPKLDKLRERYKDDKEGMAQAQMELFKKEGINPAGGCLPLLIQLPLMIGLYQAIIRSLAATPLQLLALSKDVYHWIPGLSSLIPLQSKFLWLDLALRDPYYVLPILVFITAWVYQKMVTPPATDPQAEAMNKQMMIMMPLMTAFFAMSYASGLAIYFLVSNLVGILQYLLFKEHYATSAVKKKS